MTQQYMLGAVLAVAFIGTVGVGSAIAGFGPVADFMEGEQHELIDFEASDGQCTSDMITNSSTSIENSGQDTKITHTQNISLANPAVAVEDPSFERVNESTYVLSVSTEKSNETAAQCVAYARYEASMQIPAGDDPWTVIIEHDNETAMTLYGDSNSTGASGSASAGAAVSDD